MCALPNPIPFTKGGKIFKKIKKPSPPNCPRPLWIFPPVTGQVPREDESLQSALHHQAGSSSVGTQNHAVDTRWLPPALTEEGREVGCSSTNPLTSCPPPFPDTQSSRTMGSLVLAGCEGAGRGTGARTAISGGFTFRGKLGRRAARRISR